MKNLNPIAASLAAPGAPYEFMETEIDGVAVRVFKNAPQNMVRALDNSRKDFSEAEFIVSGDLRMTFDAYYQKVDALSGWLQNEAKIQPKQHVAIAMKNCAEWMIAFTAVLQIGAVAVLVNSKGEGQTMLNAVEDGDSVFLLCDEKRMALLREAGCELPGLIAEQAAGDESFGVACDSNLTCTVPEILPDDTACLFFTSGTTGRAKAAVICHRSLVSGMMNTQMALEEAFTRIAMAYEISVEELSKHLPQTVSLMVFPLFHMSGCTSVFLTALFGGNKLVLMDRWDGKELLRLTEQEKISSIGGVPAMHWDILNAMKETDYDLSSVRSISCGGQAFPLNLIEALQEAFPNIVLGAGYGMTETTGAISSSNGEAFAKKPDSSGQIFPMVDVRIVGENGEDLPNYESGEIYARGPLIMKGYYNRPDATAEVIIDGWMKTGDIGFRDDDDYLFIIDRKTDMVISAGENIYCVEVEQTLSQNPKVKELAAFGVPDERLGERLVIVVSPADENLTSDELMAFAQENLAAYKVPSEIIIAENVFTYNAMQKIEKKILRAKYLNSEF